MHALFITYTSAVEREALREPYKEFAKMLAGGRIPGLLAKTWLYTGSTLGGFVVFREREAADRYLTELVEPVVRGDPSISNLRVERYEIDETCSAITNGLPAVSALA